ncbi:MAG TPA: hypothetical protein VJL28_09785 [Gemmatimonadaceae bacterium]|nr:hypothetical protein [Gemmatimonadaceae bacterium]
MRTSPDPQLPLLKEILPPGAVGDEAIGDVPAFLTAKYGQPRRTALGSNVTELLYALPDRNVFILVDSTSARLIGACHILLQVAPVAPPPCPTPGPVPGVSTTWGIGTATYIPILRGLADATAAATAEALLDLLTSYISFKRLICGFSCPPPCQCVATLVAPPPPAITVTPYKILGITVSVTVTVQINISFTVTCV